MGIISITENRESRSANKEFNKFRREYTRKFVVRCLDATDDPNTILASGSLPQIGTSLYPTDSGALCIKSNIHQRSGGEANVWDVGYTYSSDVPVVAQQNIDPLARPPIVKFEWQKTSIPLEKDMFGPVLNSAGQTFEMPPVVDGGQAIITIEKNYAVTTLTSPLDDPIVDILNQFLNTYNQYSWHGFEPGECKMDGITLTPNQENGIPYYNVQYRISIATDQQFNTWAHLSVLDCGYNFLDDSNKLVQAVDKNGQPTSKPVLLDGSGHLLNGTGGPGTNPPYYLFIFPYSPADWSAIP